jgi:ATP-dependent DNA helicase RecQ
VVRKNLRLSVTTIERSLPARIGCAKKLVRHDSVRQSGIIYCGTTKWCDKVAHHFNDEHIRTAVYHAKLPIQLRNQSQTAFMSDDVQFVAATVAFGMGLNKPNVRRVIHMELPSSLENYVQEIGRAGRDGNLSDCNLFLGLGDLLREYYRKSSGDPKKDSIRIANVKKIWKYAKTKTCRWQFIAEHFEGLNSGIKHEPCGVCDNCLSQLIGVPHGVNKQ